MSGMIQRKIFIIMKPKINEIWLVCFPFSDLKTNKLRPALVIAIHREEVIILGIFSKIPNDNFSAPNINSPITVTGRIILETCKT